jgi:hypothetical protein
MLSIPVTAARLVEGDQIEFSTGRRVTVVAQDATGKDGLVWLEFSDGDGGLVRAEHRYDVLTARKGRTKK